MNIMVKVGDFFLRIRNQGDRSKLTIWNKTGTKIVSEFISSTTPNFWDQIGKLTSPEVVDKVHSLLQQQK
ncbi:MAG: hypothetical protein GX335_00995 [Firmicutes bacterium]|nr:hypothetical protein [Bacillota bacterium]